MGHWGHGKSRGLFFIWKRKRKSTIGKRTFVQHRIVSAVKRVEFVSNRMSYRVLRGRWCNIFVLNVHASSQEEGDDSKGSFDEELEQVFDHFPKYRMKIILGDFNVKVDRENTFKPTIGYESLHQDSNDNGVRIVNFATSKIWLLRARCSRTETFIRTPGPLLMGRLTTRLITY